MSTFPIVMRAKKTGLVIEFHNENDGVVLECGSEPWVVGEYEHGFVPYDDDSWWEPVRPKMTLPDSLFEI